MLDAYLELLPAIRSAVRRLTQLPHGSQAST